MTDAVPTPIVIDTICLLGRLVAAETSTMAEFAGDSGKVAATTTVWGATDPRLRIQLHSDDAPEVVWSGLLSGNTWVSN